MAYQTYLTRMGKLSLHEIADHHRWADKEHLVNLARAASKDGYTVPCDVAEALCAQIRAETAGRWYSKQAWSCWCCMRMAQNGVPAGLAISRNDRCRCRAIALHAGYLTT